MDDAQRKARAIVERRERETGMDLTTLARAAGLSPSTLTRFMNGEPKHSLSAKTLWKIEAVPPVMRRPSDGFGITSDALDLYRSLPADKRRVVDNLIRDMAALSDDPESHDPPHPFGTGDNQRGQGADCDNVVPMQSRVGTAA